nr:hypothetical protein CFP56_74405 [Quercus suber]
MKARDVFDAGIGPHCDEDDTDEFLENILYSLTSIDVCRDDLRWGQDDVEGMTIATSIIGLRDLHEIDNLDECKFIDDKSNDEDDNKVEYRSLHAQQWVEVADEEAHISEDARPVATPVASDDETQAPDTDDYVQTSAPVQNLALGNRLGRRGKTRLVDIWAMTGEYKIQLLLNDEGQLIGEDRSLFIRWLGSFCENGLFCPLMSVDWPSVP